LQQITAKPQDKGARLRRFLLAGAVALLPGASHACEIALALAIDVSGSIDADEYHLQMQGMSDACEMVRLLMRWSRHRPALC
jgi:hypothetical protein